MDNENRMPSYEEFERNWKLRHKGSIPRKRRVSSTQEIFWIAFWIVVAVGAAIYSAAHTIPAAVMTIFTDVPDRDRLALTVFVIVELVIFGAAAGRHEMKWLRWLLIGAVIVALIGNLGSSIRAVADNGGDVLNQIVGIFIAIITPFTALAAGEALHIQWGKRSAKLLAEDERYSGEMREVDTKINRAFKELEKAFKPLLSAPVRRLSAQTDTDKQPKHIALDYLKTHPGEYTVRSLAEAAGVTNDAAHKAMKMFAANGHGHNQSGLLQ